MQTGAEHSAASVALAELCADEQMLSRRGPIVERNGLSDSALSVPVLSLSLSLSLPPVAKYASSCLDACWHGYQTHPCLHFLFEYFVTLRVGEHVDWLPTTHRKRSPKSSRCFNSRFKWYQEGGGREGRAEAYRLHVMQATRGSTAPRPYKTPHAAN